MNITGTALAIAALGSVSSLGALALGDHGPCSMASASGDAEIITPEYRSDIVSAAVAAGSFKTLVAALGAADLTDTLKGKGPFTVFAPTDEAFAKLPKGTVESLLKPENRDKLTSILTYHVVKGNLDAQRVLSEKTLTTLNGQRAEIKSKNGMIDSASITKTDIECSNGVIHVIDEVLLPETGTIIDVAKEAGTFKILAAALDAAGLTGALSGEGPFTVFAPTDEAFAKLPKGTLESLLKPENKDKLTSILTYHVIKGRVFSDQAVKAEEAATLEGSDIKITRRGGKVIINDATVAAADIDAVNGVVHVIDRVLLPEMD